MAKDNISLTWPGQTMAFKFYQTRPNRIKHIHVQTRSNSTKQGVQTVKCLALRAWTNEKCLATKHNQTLFGDQTLPFVHLVWCCLIVFDCIWSCLINFEGHQTFGKKRKTFVRVFDGRCFFRLGSRVSNMFDARMRTMLAQRLVSIVSSVFDQTCFNRLATHFNISMFGHQTMVDGVWSPNIYFSKNTTCN